MGVTTRVLVLANCLPVKVMPIMLLLAFPSSATALSASAQRQRSPPDRTYRQGESEKEFDGGGTLLGGIEANTAPSSPFGREVAWRWRQQRSASLCTPPGGRAAKLVQVIPKGADNGWRRRPKFFVFLPTPTPSLNPLKSHRFAS